MLKGSHLIVPFPCHFSGPAGETRGAVGSGAEEALGQRSGASELDKCSTRFVSVNRYELSQDPIEEA